MSERRARRAPARVARPLREVHDLRDRLPGLQRHAALPGAEVRRPAGRALPRAPTSPRSTPSVDYCSGCGICTQVCPQGVKIAEINAQARNKLKRQKGVPLRDRIITRPTWLGRAGTPAAPIANWTHATSARCGSLGEKLLGVHRDAPAPDVRRAALLSAGRASTRARRPARKVVYFHGCGTEYYEPRGGREGRRDPRAQRLRGRGAQAGLLRAAAAVQRPLRRRAQGRAAPGAQPGAARARRRHDHRRQRDELHADAQARGARDPRASRTIPTSSSSAERTYDICELLLELHDRGELQDRLPAAADDTIAYHAPCQQQGHWIGKPALDLLALIPGLRGDRDERALLRHRRHVRAQGREVRHRDGRRRRPLRPGARAPARRRWRATARRAAGRSRRPPSARPCTRSSSCTARTDSRTRDGRDRRRLAQRGAGRGRRRAGARDGRRGARDRGRRRDGRARRDRHRRRARARGDRARRCPTTACSC